MDFDEPSVSSNNITPGEPPPQESAQQEATVDCAGVKSTVSAGFVIVSVPLVVLLLQVPAALSQVSLAIFTCTA